MIHNINIQSLQQAYVNLCPFHVFRDNTFVWWRKQQFSENITDLQQVNDNFII